MKILEIIHKAFNDGYQHGHFTTVESMFSDTTEDADDYIKDINAGDVLEKCTWDGFTKSGSGYYATTCGDCWVSDEGTREENNFVFCPFCGRVIVEVKENKTDKLPLRPRNPPICEHGKTMHQACVECDRGRMVA